MKATYLINKQFHVRDAERGHEIDEQGRKWYHTVCGYLVRLEDQSTSWDWCEQCWQKASVTWEASVGRRHRKKRGRHKKSKPTHNPFGFATTPSFTTRTKPRVVVVREQRFEAPRIIQPPE